MQNKVQLRISIVVRAFDVFYKLTGLIWIEFILFYLLNLVLPVPYTK